MKSAEPIEFYFDFSSPYGYLASEKIDELAARFGRRVKWRPVLLGVIFKETGAVPLTQAKLKGPYFAHDFARSARFMDIPYRQPEAFPLATQVAARAYYWLHDRDCAMARAFAHAAYRALFANNTDISGTPAVLDLAAGVGADVGALATALGGDEIKTRLRNEVDAAMAKGVFGSPYIIIDGEPFFGADRLPQIERWLAAGAI